MTIRTILATGIFGLGALLAACSSDDSRTPAASGDALYVRLGKADGIETVVADFLERVKADAKINGYFLNASVDQAHLSACLVKQIGEATGGPEKYDCKSMADAHSNLGISRQDFDDLVGHLSDALVAAKVEQKDVDTILGVLGPMAADIVRDETNDATVYQRLGRKPAIQAVVTDFHSRVMADAAINSFFATTDANRLATCLVRQVCMATGGPCKYGDEIPDAEPGVKSACRTMKDAHTGLNVAYADFQELVTDLVAALDAANVPADDKNAILGVLAPMCPDIVEKDACQ
ncbi:MAG TPA: group 1 truncated hemoglobin [Polyangiaceae bacterium]|nr:group 1 truncated hemoglobin [Polyangiaceae bacterium]